MKGGANKLTARTVASVKDPGRYSDGQNLYLVVDPSGAKRWVFMFRWRRPGQPGPGRSREMGLGSIHRVELKRARELASEARRLLGEGIDPIAARQNQRDVPTFQEAAEEWIQASKASVRSDKSHARWTRALLGYAKALGPLPVNAVGTQDVVAALKPIWIDKQSSAEVARGYIEKVLDAAKASGHRTGENPARWKGHLDLLLPRPVLTTRHHEAMPYADVPVFMERLRSQTSTAARALQFSVLTASRPGNVRKAKWSEVDLSKAIWTISDTHMKAGRVHRVPLPEACLEILLALREVYGAEADTLTFPGEKESRPLSNMTFKKLMERMGVRGTPHGFRSSFRDWVGNETSHPRELAEECLAHVIGNETEQSYRRGDALNRRRIVMSDWAAHCGSAR